MTEGIEQKAVQGIGRLIWRGVKRLFRIPRPTWQQQALERQTQIAILKTGSDSDLQRAVIEGDKLLDFILTHRGAKGSHLGEKLKRGRALFASEESYRAAWEAHRIRNLLVHEYTRVNSAVCRKAIDNFMKAYKGLGL